MNNQLVYQGIDNNKLAACKMLNHGSENEDSSLVKSFTQLAHYV